MEHPEHQTETAAPPDESGIQYPPGDHPLEVAARRGIGPLSPLAKGLWHGQARPCVTCGQLVPREATLCDYCEQDLSEEMLEKMRAHAGPWYILEHVRPFPGVSLERVIRQVRRGVLVETSIVRGPSTDYQWRFAVETPGLCRYFGKCWHCHGVISPSDTYCSQCLSHLSFERPRTTEAPKKVGEPAAPAAPQPVSAAREPVRSQPPEAPTSPVRPIAMERASRPSESGEEIRRLSAALEQADLPEHEPVWDEPPRIGGIRATWVVAGLLVIVIVVLMMLTESRREQPRPKSLPPPGAVLPQVLPAETTPAVRSP